MTAGDDFAVVADFAHQSGVGTAFDLRAGGATSIVDALAAAALSRPALNRRRIIFAFTDGFDTMSVLAAHELLAITRRSEAVIHLFLTQPATRTGTTKRLDAL